MLRRKNSKNVREFSFGLVWYDPSSQDGSSLFNLAIPRILGRVTGLTQLRGGREEEEWREGGGEGGTGHMDSGAQQSAVRGPETLFSPKHTHVDPTRRRRGKCLENNVHRQVHLKSVRGHDSTGGSGADMSPGSESEMCSTSSSHARSLCRLLLLFRSLSLSLSPSQCSGILRIGHSHPGGLQIAEGEVCTWRRDTRLTFAQLDTVSVAQFGRNPSSLFRICTLRCFAIQ